MYFSMKFPIWNFEVSLKTLNQSFPLEIWSSQIKNTGLWNYLSNSSFTNCSYYMNYVFLNKIFQSPLQEEQRQKVVWEQKLYFYSIHFWFAVKIFESNNLLKQIKNNKNPSSQYNIATSLKMDKTISTENLYHSWKIYIVCNYFTQLALLIGSWRDVWAS